MSKGTNLLTPNERVFSPMEEEAVFNVTPCLPPEQKEGGGKSREKNLMDGLLIGFNYVRRSIGVGRSVRRNAVALRRRFGV